MNFVLFAFGAAVGSFMNVLALRYDPDRFLFERRVLGGRSRCPKCGKTLRWFELVPILSFILQGGRCRTCKKPISPQYLVGEVVCGLIFVLVAARPAGGAFFPWYDAEVIPTLFFIAVFAVLFLITSIDLRTMIIPDELNIALGVLGFFIGGMSGQLIAHIGAGIAAAAAFLLLVLGTRGKGMGVGDVKLVAALGLIFGWPATLIVLAGGFIIGAFYGILALLARTKTLASAVPFAPFLAVSSFAVFLWGDILEQAIFFTMARVLQGF
ncbi:MAG: hypothetical protein RL681_497 [Candidatus Parcubacteria bacterium]|jgi:leader peptidase (prepilin peptidase)/N-methyltransferase